MAGFKTARKKLRAGRGTHQLKKIRSIKKRKRQNLTNV